MVEYRFLYFLLAMGLILGGCAPAEAPQPALPLSPPESAQIPEKPRDALGTQRIPAPPDGISLIFSVARTDGADDGVERLLALMEQNGVPFYQSASAQGGLIASTDVVLLEINCQWAERGGTNTDLIKSVIEALLRHPDGFKGEIIVADNGQAQYGSERRGGSLDWAAANALDRGQSALDVVKDFELRGARVSGVLWDDFTTVRVREFSQGDFGDGFVVEDTAHPTGLLVSYPKFTTRYGTRVSFKAGIWNDQRGAYDSGRLKVINMPVLKSHGLYQVTGAVKGYMGTTSDKLTGGRAHNSVGSGGMGTQMANTRMPVLNIMDMIWVGAERGPGVSYESAVQLNRVAASADPVALDYWAAKHVLIPEAEKLPGGRTAAMNPAGNTPGTFGYWLKLSADELAGAGFHVTLDEAKMRVIAESGGNAAKP